MTTTYVTVAEDATYRTGTGEDQENVGFGFETGAELVADMRSHMDSSYELLDRDDI